MKHILYITSSSQLQWVPEDKVLNTLYELQGRVPTEADIKSPKRHPADITAFFKNNVKEAINKIKDGISQIGNKVPLYDPYTENMYLIPSKQVYDRVVHHYYRFPDQKFVEKLQNRKAIKSKVKKLDTLLTDTYHKVKESVINARKERKTQLILEFLENFNLDILATTYIKQFYLHANEVGKNITVCRRPSFRGEFRHIKPYYSRSEIINLALNMGFIKPDSKMYSTEEIMKLCSRLQELDIHSDTLLKHQNHILAQSMVGLIEYYTVQGSYFMNQYLRGFESEFKNKHLEELIKLVWKTIGTAPAFDKEYTLYRFVHNDEHLKGLRVGSIYADPGFVSCTRDPFYRSETYKFGFILLKIRIPKGMSGVALCVETLSEFPEEQETILAPRTELRLVKKDANCDYYHTDDNYQTKIATRYEFEIVKTNPPTMPDYIDKKKNPRPVDFLDMSFIPTDEFTIEENIKQFYDAFVDPHFRTFITKVNGKEVVLNAEWYDSTGAYSKFYRVTTKNGFSVYLVGKYGLEFMLELGEVDGERYSYANFWFRNATTPDNKTLTDSELILLLSQMCHFFKISRVDIYSDYLGCKDTRASNYRRDFYQYLKHKKKRFLDVESGDILTGFSYMKLDKLKTISVGEALRKTDQDELYQIYRKIYLPYKFNDNLADFYIWLVEFNCGFVSLLEDKMHRVFQRDNPFEVDYYSLNVGSFLYNSNLIPSLPRSASMTGSQLTRQENQTAVYQRFPKNIYRT